MATYLVYMTESRQVGVDDGPLVVGKTVINGSIVIAAEASIGVSPGDAIENSLLHKCSIPNPLQRVRNDIVLFSAAGDSGQTIAYLTASDRAGVRALVFVGDRPLDPRVDWAYFRVLVEELYATPE
jgi:hypothetical protein